jgi:protein-tyrosine phosphatase
MTQASKEMKQMNNEKQKVSVLFVCMGNICRSPTAEGVFRHVVKQQNLADLIQIDSAGTHAYHIGESPDSRSQATAKNRGVDLSSQRARKVEIADFETFDYVIAMDGANLQDLKRLANEKQREKIHLFMGFAKEWDNTDVPDPYYGGEKGFDRVFDMVQAASQGLLQLIIKNHF